MLLVRVGKSAHGKSRCESFGMEAAVILLCSEKKLGLSVVSYLGAALNSSFTSLRRWGVA